MPAYSILYTTAIVFFHLQHQVKDAVAADRSRASEVISGFVSSTVQSHH